MHRNRHSYSDQRFAPQREVLDWLFGVRSVSCNSEDELLGVDLSSEPEFR